ncbi:MAG: NAD(P)-dependent oxidoreductase [Candidatus Pacearchaeota archaeon]|nr:NAD(P)-dependent oxidoreductase [Candidatus Pacearchaeota archaeon]
MIQEKILVTGGCGYIGSILVPELLREGYFVRVFDNLSCDSGHTMMAHLINPNFEFVKGDVRNEQETAKAMEGMDIIIHLAAIVSLASCERNPKLAQEVNVEGTKNILKNRGDKLIIYASTISNYGETSTQMCSEETGLNPKNTYAITKTEAEKLVKDSGNCIIFRFATAFGCSNRLRINTLINDFAYRAIKDKQLLVYQKSFKRPFVHIRDITSGLIFALKNRDKMLNQIYNLGSNEANLTKEDVALIIKNKVPKFLLFMVDSEGSDDRRNFFIDYSKISSLGFKTKISVEEGIDELIKGIGLIDVKNPYVN